MIELYKIIRKYRTAANLTQADIAEVCGVTRNAVTQWESLNQKTRTEPSINDLEKIAELCETSLTRMLSDYNLQESEAEYIVSENIVLSESEHLLLRGFRLLDLKDQQFLLEMLENLNAKQ